LENKVESLEMAVELIKSYGFQPKEFDKFIEEIRAKKSTT